MNKDILFDTQEKINKAINDFSSLLEHPGWKLYVKILDTNIELIKQQLEEGSETETKVDIDRLRDKLRIFRETRDKPLEMLKMWQSDEVKPINDDPYATVEDEFDKESEKV